MKLCTSSVVADWLALTPRRVRQLRDEGVLTEKASGLYDLKAVVTQYILYVRKGGQSDFQDERARLTRAKRKAAELEHEQRIGNLHTTEDIEQGLTTLFLNIRGRFSALPAKLSGELAQMGGNQMAIFDALKENINEILEELSDYRAMTPAGGACDNENNTE